MKFFKKLYRAFFPEFILNVTHRGDDRKIHVKNFKKLSPKRISGVTKGNQEFDMVSNEPMDYYIIEYRDDLK
jgi:hypothetical protein